MKKTTWVSLALVLCLLLGSTTALASDAKPYEGETLTVLFMSSVYADAARSVADEFKEVTGATLEVVDYPYITLHDKALLDLTSGTASYDVIDVACQWDGEFAPYMLDLTELIAKDSYDTSAFIENVFAQAGTWQGVVKGIPNANTPQVVAYRTDLIPDGLPATWDEYCQLLEKLTDPAAGVYGIATPGVREQFGGIWDSMLWSSGGAWADEDWNITIDSPETRTALDIAKRQIACADPAALSWGLEEAIAAFLDGKAAICDAWPTLGITLKGDDPAQSKIVGKWALGTFPYEKNGITNLSAWDLGINAASTKQELSWEFIKLYTSAEKQQTFYEQFYIFSPRKDFWEQQSIKDAGLYPLRTALDTALIWWRVAASVEADTAIGTAVNAYLSGQSDIETAVANMKAGLEQALLMNPIEEGVKNFNR